MKNSKTFLGSSIVAGLFFVFSTVAAAGPLRLNMGSTKATSSIYVAGQAVVDVVNKYAGDVVLLTHVETSGGKDDVVRMRRGDIDGMPAGTGVAHLRDLYRGVGSQKGKPPYPSVRQWIINGFGPYQIVTPAREEIKDVMEFQGKKVSPGAPNSGADSVMRPAIEALGIKPKWYLGSYRDASAKMMNRELSGYIKYCQMGTLDATMLNIMSSIPIKAIGFTKAQKEKLSQWNSRLDWFYVKVGSYRELPNDGDFWLPGATSSGGLSSKIPQEIGYRMTKAVFDHMDEILKAFPKYTPNTLEGQLELATKWVKAGAPPLQAGFIQYAKEKGLKVPPSVIPPEYKEK